MDRRAVSTVGAAVAGGAVFLGSLAATAAITLARQVLTPSKTRRGPVRVVRCVLEENHANAGLITLQRTTESEIAGEYTLLWNGVEGRAKVGEIVTATLETVTRKFWDAQGTPITQAHSVRVASAPQRHVRDLGLPWQRVTVSGELGQMWGWCIPAASQGREDWVIHIHGRGAALTEPLRTVPIVHELGWNSLVVHYRNDLGMPAAADRKYGLGATEWRDIEAAIAWAHARGARRIVLCGWSMGAAIAGQTYLNSVYRPLIAGIMFESPALDWREILSYQAGQLRVPGWVARLGMRLFNSPLHRVVLGTREAISLELLDLVARADEFTVPILVLHSTADTVVPVRASQRFANRRDDIVTYVEFARGRHTRLWNVDRTSWECAVHDWFADFGASAQPA